MALDIEQRIQHFSDNAADITGVATRGATPDAAAVSAPGRKEETASDAPDDRLSPAAGVTMRDFKTYLSRALQGDTAGVPASILVCAGAVAAREDGGDTKKRGDEWWEYYFWDWAIRQQAEALERIARQYEEMAAWYKEQEGKTIEEMDKLVHLMEKPSAFLNEVDEIESEQRRTEKFDRQKCLKALRERGVNIKDGISDDDLIARFEKQKEQDRKFMEETHRLHETLDKNREEYRKQGEDAARKAREAWEVREKLRTVQSDAGLGPEAKHQQTQEIVKEAGARAAYDAARWEEDKIQQSRTRSEIEKLAADSTANGAKMDLNDDAETHAESTSKLAMDFRDAGASIKNNAPIPVETPNPPEPDNTQKLTFGPGLG